MATSTSTTRSPITTAGFSLDGLAAHRPGAGDQVDTPVGLDLHRRLDPLAERGAPILAQRHAVAGGRTLTTGERRPVVVEVPEDRGHVDREHTHLCEAGRLEQLDQRPRPRDRESAALVELEG